MAATVVEPTLTPISAEELDALFEPAALDADVETLAKEARETLGYTTLQEKIEQDTITPRNQRHLLAILREHGTPLYREADVKAYQQAKIESVMQPLRRRISIREATFTLLFLAVFLALILQDTLGIASYRIDGVAPWVLGWAAGCIGMIDTARLKSLCMRTDAKWNRYELKLYAREIPIPVLQLATQLKKQAPNLQVSIEEFAVRRRPLDPLCFVELGKARFCIGVWDEPDFDAELTH